jgi:DNA repair protein RecO (recombination protein O)
MKRGVAAGRAPPLSQGGTAGLRAVPSRPLQAFVLHRYDWSESSLILDLFTRERGRIAVAAKGAKRPYSQLRAVLLPFQRALVSLGRSADDDSAEVHTLRAAEWAGGAPMPGGAALIPGFYLNELLLRLLARQDPHPQLFDAYADALPALQQGDEPSVQAALRAFELVLLREIGVLPDLHVETLTQQPLRADAAYALRPEVGVVAAGAGNATLAGAQWVALQAALAHGSVEALRGACAVALPPLRAALRALLHYHLGSQTLRTRQVMADVRKLLEPQPEHP